MQKASGLHAFLKETTLLLGVVALFLFPKVARASTSFVSLFDGKDLNGWVYVGSSPGYEVRDGILICPAGCSGNLFTEKEYSDFVLDLDFRLSENANNGVGIRAPLQGDAAYMGMEIQILDDSGSMYQHLQPWQYCGSIYNVVPAKQGSLKPVGEWNHEEITAIGRHIKVVLNGKTVVNADLNKVLDPTTLLHHPGMLRDTGHIGLLGHEPTEVDFRNIAIKDLSRPHPDNVPPPGFKALFNGRDLKGWRGFAGDPPTRAKMTEAEWDAAVKQATKEAFKHWRVENGVITYDGKNNNLCTVKDYGNFELLVDWKIPPHGDSGIYLRGSPQVQIWDNPIGSGGLYNNEKHPSNPMVFADNPVGQWNQFRILMIGDMVTVYLNNKLVVWNVPLENYWERNKPIYPIGPIELQHHWTPLWFKNIYIRELPLLPEQKEAIAQLHWPGLPSGLVKR